MCEIKAKARHNSADERLSQKALSLQIKKQKALNTNNIFWQMLILIILCPHLFSGISYRHTFTPNRFFFKESEHSSSSSSKEKMLYTRITPDVRVCQQAVSLEGLSEMHAHYFNNNYSHNLQSFSLIWKTLNMSEISALGRSLRDRDTWGKRKCNTWLCWRKSGSSTELVLI